MSRISFKNICEEKNQLDCPSGFLLLAENKGGKIVAMRIIDNKGLEW